MPYYLDTSAAVKLVVAEKESTALVKWMRAKEGEVVTSDLLRTELLRAVQRGAPDSMVRARAVLDSVTILALPTEVFERAAILAPTTLRSLDALHLGAALQLGDELRGVVTYDARFAAGARHLGIDVIAPGLSRS